MALLAALDDNLGDLDLVLATARTGLAELHLVRVLLLEEGLALAQPLEGEPPEEGLVVGLGRVVLRVVALLLQHRAVAGLCVGAAPVVLGVKVVGEALDELPHKVPVREAVAAVVFGNVECAGPGKVRGRRPCVSLAELGPWEGGGGRPSSPTTTARVHRSCLWIGGGGVGAFVFDNVLASCCDLGVQVCLFTCVFLYVTWSVRVLG